jgi:hypothetical protein
MFKIKNEFDRLGLLADAVNKKINNKRFILSQSANKRYMSYCLYDYVTKNYVVFNTIMFSGHYQYNKNVVPAEFVEMENLLTNAA